VVKLVRTSLQVAVTEAEATITADELPVVAADETQMVQLFQNLFTNAIKFRGSSAPSIHVGVEEGSDEWTFSVRDNGIGFEQEYADKIFGIFQRLHTRDEYPGTGIGLSLCKRIVERRGGRIWAEAEPGKGAAFFFTVPKGEEQEE
jgi:light-regulated signal transduction histidine kinase (bacteriophytochrome)